MSVVIVGGHDRMVSQYVKICKSFNCKAKVFTQMTADFGKQIGREKEYIIPFCDICQIGDDIILVRLKEEREKKE